MRKGKNILYTGYGDKGTTTLFNCKQERVSKSSNIIEALGSVDELNAYLGVVKVESGNDKLKLTSPNINESYDHIINEIQQTLFVIQAELAGSDMTVKKEALDYIESIIEEISELLPPITSFTISGGSMASALLDVSRTLARRSERRVVAVSDEGIKSLGENTITYLNRLSSVLFALSRHSNYLLNEKEDHPRYNN
jgi:cob(I)alamin adenosyltransferase